MADQAMLLRRARGLRPQRPARLLTLLLAYVALRGLLPTAFAPGAGHRRVVPHRQHSTSARFESRVARASRGGESSDGFEVGDKVQAVSPDDEQRYPGTIESANDDGTFTVRWDDPDGGPETDNIEAGKMRKIIIFKDYVVGDDVKAISADDGRWYEGSVTKVNKDGTFTVKWDDPDGGPETAEVKPEEMKKVTVFKDYKVDDTVEAVFPDDGQMYPGTVTAINKDGTFQVKWDDPDGGPEDSPVGPKEMRYPPIPVENLEVGQKFTGTVRNVREFGGFVDIGATGDGLVHISRISTERVENVYDWLEEGQEVEVWVSEIREDGKFGLTMVEGITGGRGGGRAPKDVTPFAEVPSEEWLDGVVRNIAPFGAFVTVTAPTGETADGLVHLTRIREGFVENVEDELSVGQEVKVRVDSVDLETQKMGLSMREPGAGGGGGGGPREPQNFQAFANQHPAEYLTGTVSRTAPFGAFVTVTAEDGSKADGLVHITAIKDGFVESVDDELQAGQEVQVRVLSVDTEQGRMSLSMKPPDY